MEMNQTTSGVNTATPPHAAEATQSKGAGWIFPSSWSQNQKDEWIQWLHSPARTELPSAQTSGSRK